MGVAAGDLRARVAHCAPGTDQPLTFLLQDRVAFACPRFQAPAIDDGKAAATAMDQTRTLQVSGGLGDAFAAHAQHLGNDFMRHRHFAVPAVEHEKIQRDSRCSSEWCLLQAAIRPVCPTTESV